MNSVNDEIYKQAEKLVTIKSNAKGECDNNNFVKELVKFIYEYNLNTHENIEELVKSAEKGIHVGNEQVSIKVSSNLGVLRPEKDGQYDEKGKKRYTDYTVSCNGNNYYVMNNWKENSTEKSTEDDRFIMAKWIFEKVGLTTQQIEELENVFARSKSAIKENKQKEESEKDFDSSQSSPNKNTHKLNGQNLIIYGAPGTGKSHHAEEIYGKDNITRVVFHPEYTYFDFVGQYRPSPLYKKNNVFVSAGECGEEKCEPFIDYAFVPGPFTNVLVEAWKAWDKWKKKKENNKEDKMPMYTLLIEELNRADAAAVFGDVFQLLDRKNGISEYDIKPSKEWGEYIYKELSKCEESLAELGIKDTEKRTTSDGLKIKIPENMNVIATMNSADQGVYMLDTAFKRRWDYYFVPIQYNDKELNIEIEYNNGKYTWNQIVKAINERLIDDGPNISEDRLIGPYFVKPDKIKSNPDEAIRKILFYLWDDVLRNNGRKKIFGEENKTMNDLYENYKNGDDVLKIKDILPPNDQAENDKTN